MRRLVLQGPRRLRLRCEVPERGRERARGLLGRVAVAPDEALLIPNATSVHSVGMRFPVLVARLDGSLRVVDVRSVAPGRLVLPSLRARHVLECHVGIDLRPGDALRLAILPRLPPGPGAGPRCVEGVPTAPIV